MQCYGKTKTRGPTTYCGVSCMKSCFWGQRSMGALLMVGGCAWEVGCCWSADGCAWREVVCTHRCWFMQALLVAGSRSWEVDFLRGFSWDVPWGFDVSIEVAAVDLGLTYRLPLAPRESSAAPSHSVWPSVTTAGTSSWLVSTLRNWMKWELERAQ